MLSSKWTDLGIDGQVRFVRLVHFQTDNFRLHDEVNGLREIAWASVFLWNGSINIYIHSWICLLKQQTSITVYRFQTNENKLPVPVSVCIKEREVFRFCFPFATYKRKLPFSISSVFQTYTVYTENENYIFMYMYMYILYICVYLHVHTYKWKNDNEQTINGSIYKYLYAPFK